MTVRLAQDAQTYDCRKAFADELHRAGPRGRADRRRLQRLGRLEQPRRLPRGVPRPPHQRRHRRAGPRRRRRRPRQRRPHPLRLAPPRRSSPAARSSRSRPTSPTATRTSCCAARAPAWPTASWARRTTRSRTCPGRARSPTCASSCPPTRRRRAPPCAGRPRTPGPLLSAHPALQGPGCHPGRRAVRARAQSVRLPTATTSP